MKSPGYSLSEQAILDLEEIWQYTADQWSVTQADRYYQLIIDEIKFLCQHQASSKDMGHVRKGYRASKVKAHLIFYRVAARQIEVIRILHERMDIDSRLRD